MFLSSLFVIVSNQRNKFPSTGEWMHKPWDGHPRGRSTATRQEPAARTQPPSAHITESERPMQNAYALQLPFIQSSGTRKPICSPRRQVSVAETGAERWQWERGLFICFTAATESGVHACVTCTKLSTLNARTLQYPMALNQIKSQQTRTQCARHPVPFPLPK